MLYVGESQAFRNNMMNLSMRYGNAFKSKKRRDHIEDLQETFINLREANLKLNPNKCTFGVQKGKILGYTVLAKGIDPNPDKV